MKIGDPGGCIERRRFRKIDVYAMSSMSCI